MSEKFRKKIIFTIPSFERGGAEEYVLLIAKHLILNNWEVHAVCEKRRGMQNLISDMKSIGIIHHDKKIAEDDTGANSIDLNEDKYETYKALFKEIEPQIIQINLPWFTKGFPAMRASLDLKIKTISMFHLVPDVFYIDDSVKKNYHVFLKNNHFWLTVSNDNKKNIAGTFSIDEKFISVIYNGVSMEKFNCDHTVKTDIRKKIFSEFNIKEGSFLILTVGAYNRRKGYEYLLNIIPKLLKNFSDIVFLWVGSDIFDDEFMDKIINTGLSKRIILAGFRRDIPDLLLSSDLFVNPSIMEGFPFSIIEAMASGLPIVSTNVNGIPEIINDHEHGLLCNSRNSEELYKTISIAKNNIGLMKEMALKAKERSGIFSLGIMLNRTLFFINNLLDYN